MKIAHISTGAAGMYCGTCMHNNTLARALIRQGHDVTLVPLYTPLRTDEDSVAIDRVFFGAVNVYLQQSSWLFRHTPRFVDWLLDRPRLLDWVSRFSGSTEGKSLGAMTLALLEGEHGPTKKELEKLVEWLAELEPDVVHLSLSLLLGTAHRIKEELGVPIVCELQGEDIFFDDIPEPYHSRVIEAMQKRTADIDAFIAPCQYYADLMSAECGFPAEKMRIAPLGIESHGFRARPERPAASEKDGDAPWVLGYLARVCPEKGFEQVVEAFRLLARDLGPERIELRAAGYLKELDRPFFEEQVRRLSEWGLGERFHYAGEVDRDGKIDFLAGLDVFALPTLYREPKGLSALEAMAAGVPVVVPAHGGFPELIDSTGGGVTVTPESPEALATAVRELFEDDERRSLLGHRGATAVAGPRGDDAMARRVAEIYREALGRDEATTSPTAEIAA